MLSSCRKDPLSPYHLDVSLSLSHTVLQHSYASLESAPASLLLEHIESSSLGDHSTMWLRRQGSRSGSIRRHMVRLVGKRFQLS